MKAGFYRWMRRVVILGAVALGASVGWDVYCVGPLGIRLFHTVVDAALCGCFVSTLGKARK